MRIPPARAERRKWARPPPFCRGRQRSGARSALAPAGRPRRCDCSAAGPSRPGLRHKNPSSLKTFRVVAQESLPPSVNFAGGFITKYATLAACFRGSSIQPRQTVWKESLGYFHGLKSPWEACDPGPVSRRTEIPVCLQSTFLPLGEPWELYLKGSPRNGNETYAHIDTEVQREARCTRVHGFLVQRLRGPRCAELHTQTPVLS